LPGHHSARRSVLTGAGALLTKVAASPDGKLAIAGDYDGKVIVWDGTKMSVLRGTTPPSSH
jgi:hypothetical protein